MKNLLVSVIMPTANRPHFLERAINNFLKQDYRSDNELIIISNYGEEVSIPEGYEELFVHSRYTKYYNYDTQNSIVHTFNDGNIVEKRNHGVRLSNESIILHMDDDDFYSSDWITKSVNHLLTTGVDLTGLYSSYFCEPPNKALLYTFDTSLPPNKPYVIGATMCYLKSFWEKHPFYFRDGRTNGEDWNFSVDCNNLIPHNYTDGFVAMLHGANTASHKNLTANEFQTVSMDKIRSIMGSEFERFTAP